MRLVYIILAHQNPLQLERLVSKLMSKDVEILIHLDKRFSIEEFIHIETSTVKFIKNRVNCIWGDFSLVIATLNLLNEVKVSIINYDYIILLSGSDYPIKNNDQIREYLSNDNKDIYIDINDAFENWVDFKRRVDYYRINKSDKRGDFLLLKGFSYKLLKLLFNNKITLKEFFYIVFVKRRNNLNLSFYGGSQWFAAKNYVVNCYLDYIDRNWDEILNFFKYSNIPDEFFFQSIINKLSLDNLKIGESLTYVNWKKKGRKLPLTFESEDFLELLELQDNKLFARKFGVDTDILDMIDGKLLI